MPAFLSTFSESGLGEDTPHGMTTVRYTLAFPLRAHYFCFTGLLRFAYQVDRMIDLYTYGVDASLSVVPLFYEDPK